MTTYRLLNNVFEYKEAFVDFKAMRRNYDGLKVWFNEENNSLNDKLLDKWVPVDILFEASSHAETSADIPDISIWNMSCLVISEKALDALKSLLETYGEILPLKDGYYLFNCLKSVASDVIDGQNSSFEIEETSNTNNELLGTPKKLLLLSSKIKGVDIFKPGFAHNSFLICQNEFKNIVENSNLGGLIFEENLAQILPVK